MTNGQPPNDKNAPIDLDAERKKRKRNERKPLSDLRKTFVSKLDADFHKDFAEESNISPEYLGLILNEIATDTIYKIDSKENLIFQKAHLQLIISAREMMMEYILGKYLGGQVPTENTQEKITETDIAVYAYLHIKKNNEKDTKEFEDIKDAIPDIIPATEKDPKAEILDERLRKILEEYLTEAKNQNLNKYSKDAREHVRKRVREGVNKIRQLFEDILSEKFYPRFRIERSYVMPDLESCVNDDTAILWVANFLLEITYKIREEGSSLERPKIQKQRKIVRLTPKKEEGKRVLALIANNSSQTMDLAGLVMQLDQQVFISDPIGFARNHTLFEIMTTLKARLSKYEQGTREFEQTKNALATVHEFKMGKLRFETQPEDLEKESNLISLEARRNAVNEDNDAFLGTLESLINYYEEGRKNENVPSIRKHALSLQKKAAEKMYMLRLLCLQGRKGIEKFQDAMGYLKDAGMLLDSGFLKSPSDDTQEQLGILNKVMSSIVSGELEVTADKKDRDVKFLDLNDIEVETDALAYILNCIYQVLGINPEDPNRNSEFFNNKNSDKKRGSEEYRDFCLNMLRIALEFRIIG